MPVPIGYLISFLTGGLAGAIINRFFLLRDRAIKKITLNVEKEEVRSIIPVTINNKSYKNLIYKKFTLVNSTKIDFESIDIVFEFDKGSEIVNKEVSSKKHGKNKFKFTERKPSELVYHIINYNRTQEIIFIFEVANITENFFCAIVDNCGVEIVVVRKKGVNQPSISPSRIVDKIQLD